MRREAVPEFGIAQWRTNYDMFPFCFLTAPLHFASIALARGE